MTEQDLTFTLIFGELAFIQLLILSGFAVNFIVRARKRSRLLAETMQRDQDTRPERAEQIKSAIKSISGISTNSCSEISSSIFDKESSLKQDIISAIITGKAAVADEIAGRFEQYSDELIRSISSSRQEGNSNCAKPVPDENILDIDNAIDELINDDSSSENDPAFDLSDVDDADINTSDTAEAPEGTSADNNKPEHQSDQVATGNSSQS